MFLWLKALHIIAMVVWFAGLFYLPRLFVYHAQATDAISQTRFKIMERKLYYGIMTPGAVMTLLLGVGLLSTDWNIYQTAVWFHAKAFCVVCLILFHLYCGHLRKQFAQDKNTHSHIFYRWINEVPTVFLIAIVILVVVKPTFI